MRPTTSTKAPDAMLRYPTLGQSPKVAVMQFLHLCREVGADANVVRDYVADLAAFLRKTSEGRQLSTSRGLEARWYASLARGVPDYSVYAADEYLGEAWGCWAYYSRGYLRDVAKPNSLLVGGSIQADLGRVRAIVDLGCGIGYTTRSLRELFPTAGTVYGTQLETSLQMRIARRITAGCGVVLTEVLPKVQGVDLVFASEYFEHFHTPVQHLHEVLDATAPKALLIANAFGTHSVGHFDTYLVNGELIDGSKTSRAFAKALRTRGYEKIKTRFWNDRPSYWKLSRGQK